VLAGRLQRAVLPAVLALAVCAGGWRAQAAQAAAGGTIAVLDVQEVLREAKAAKALRARIEKEQADYQGELAKQENGLRSASDELMRQRDQLAAEEFLRRRQEIDRQVAELRRQAQGRKRQLEADYNGGMDRVRQAMLQVVATIAQAEGATLVLNKSSVVLGTGALDVTAETLAKLDAALPSADAATPQ
jgi:Skp family chaperone for outer membrane proteins